jgi:succinate dehydrogenase hydrophobic anchor subunit
MTMFDPPKAISSETRDWLPAMSSKEKFDALMKLSEFRVARWNVRQGIEWKISYGFWALLAASPLYVRNRPNDFWLAAILVTVLVLYIILWIWQIWNRNSADVKKSFEYANAAIGVLQGKTDAMNLIVPGTEEKWLEATDILNCGNWKEFFSLRSWAVWFQIATAVTLAIFSFHFIGTAQALEIAT